VGSSPTPRFKEGDKMKKQEEKTYAMLTHLLAFVGFIIPFGNIIGPLVMWLVKKDQSKLVDGNGKASLNFQISMTIYMIISAILILLVIGFVLLIVLAILWFIFIIIASIKASEGKIYKYPATIKFIP
jgi:uncharacterized Tic20 family protein